MTTTPSKTRHRFSEAHSPRRLVTDPGSTATPTLGCRWTKRFALATVDVGGRPFAVIDLELSTPYIGKLATQNISHALEAFCRTSGITLHLSATGDNDHHVAEAAFKALAQALKARCCH